MLLDEVVSVFEGRDSVAEGQHRGYKGREMDVRHVQTSLFRVLEFDVSPSWPEGLLTVTDMRGVREWDERGRLYCAKS